ncbi:MAG TPA: hypothetical protein VGQ36_21465 [Thermoanaerobaculia bacterium]|jgi:hypothetical protein|nr:hypothetical protein [Thermoanaerobaculia bacterium]
MKSRLIPVVVVAFVAAAMSAQVKNGIEHTPLSCIRAGELPLLQVKTTGKGELRGYFRRINTTDWCSVEGTNDGPLSRVVLPKFENGDEIEYFFVLIDGSRVVGRSARIYRTRVNLECESPFARHILRLTMNCGEDVQAIPTALGAGFTVGSKLIRGNPPVISQDEPVVTTTDQP